MIVLMDLRCFLILIKTTHLKHFITFFSLNIETKILYKTNRNKAYRVYLLFKYPISLKYDKKL